MSIYRKRKAEAIVRITLMELMTDMYAALPWSGEREVGQWLDAARNIPLLEQHDKLDLIEEEFAKFQEMIPAGWSKYQERRSSMERMRFLQLMVVRDLDSLERSEKARNSARARGENPVHDKIERLGQQAAFDHEPHELVRVVRRSLRADEKLSDRQVRRVLQDRGILRKRTQRR